MFIWHILILTYSYFTLLIWDLYFTVWYSNSTDLSLYLLDLALYLTDLTLYLTDFTLYFTDLELRELLVIFLTKERNSSGDRTWDLQHGKQAW